MADSVTTAYEGDGLTEGRRSDSYSRALAFSHCQPEANPDEEVASEGGMPPAALMARLRRSIGMLEYRHDVKHPLNSRLFSMLRGVLRD